MTRSWTGMALALLLLSAAPAWAQAPAKPAAAATANTSVTFEYYYRIKWGSDLEFIRLYEKNHAPLLEEMRKAGFIKSMKVEQPFTHMAGGERWNLRVTVVYRDATRPSATRSGGGCGMRRRSGSIPIRRPSTRRKSAVSRCSRSTGT